MSTVSGYSIHLWSNTGSNPDFLKKQKTWRVPQRLTLWVRNCVTEFMHHYQNDSYLLISTLLYHQMIIWFTMFLENRGENHLSVWLTKFKCECWLGGTLPIKIFFYALFIINDTRQRLHTEFQLLSWERSCRAPLTGKQEDLWGMFCSWCDKFHEQTVRICTFCIECML